MTNEQRIAVKAVRLAKFLAAYGCCVLQFYAARSGSCYITAAIYGKRFCVRVSDHRFSRSKGREEKLPTYPMRVDVDNGNNLATLGRWISQQVFQRTSNG